MKELVGGPAKQILSRTSPLSQFLISCCFFDNFLSKIFIMTTMTTDDIAIQGHDNLKRKSVIDIKKANLLITQLSKALIGAFHVKMCTTTNKADV